MDEGLEWIHLALGQDLVWESYQHGNEISGSMKDEGINS